MIEWRTGADRAVPAYAAAHDVELLLAGVLFDLDVVAARWNLPDDVASNPAAVALEAYRRLGESWTDVLNGRFALLLADRGRRRVLAVRDRMGWHPLYYARGPHDRLIVSPAIPALLADPDVPRTLNRVVLAEHVLHRFVDTNETHYSAVRRVPPGHVLTVAGAEPTTHRYWDPGKSVRWLKEDELGLFDQAFERAVARCLPGRPAIFLSGGFDSVSVAAVATDLTARQGRPKPHALSLDFPDPHDSEGFIQRSVANRLGLSQDFVTFDEAVSGRGLIRPSLDLGATWPLPMINLWAPAYQHLGRLGAARGCTSILTGTGGDEWLNVSPYLAADFIRAGRLRELAGLFGTFRRSFNFPMRMVAHNLLWRYGLRPVAGAAADRIAPEWYAAWRKRGAINPTPAWAAPDPAIRRAMDDRAPALLRTPRPPEGFYQQHMHGALDYPLAAMEYEEHFEFGRRLGMQMLHPYLDADLVELLYRTPPALLARGGRTKAMVRTTTARRFPELGFKAQRKTDATDFFRKVLQDEGGAAWAASKGVSALAELGVVDGPGVSAQVNELIAGARPNQTYRVWTVLNLERWVRARLQANG